MTIVELETTAMAVGGESIAREPSGRVVFIGGALPGERVVVRLTEERKRFARGEAVEVLDASPDRIEPACPAVALGCGGCDWQHIEAEARRRLRLSQVRESLERTGRIDSPKVDLGAPIPDGGPRTTVRGVADPSGRFAFHRRRSEDLIAVGRCPITHPLVDEIIEQAALPAGSSVMIRVGARTGERMVVIDGDPSGVVAPPDVLVVSSGDPKALRRAAIHEVIAGSAWRVSARSFLQPSPEGAEALVETVGGIVADHGSGDAMVDLCSGIGLFAGTVAGGRQVVAVESNRAAVGDARRNLRGLPVENVPATMAAWRPTAADVVVADPPRSGLERVGVERVAATGADLCVLVSCEVGSLGRDALLLGEAGYEHAGSVTLDLFGPTGRVEVVSTFLRR